ncbi:hypothetical protein D9758_016446 [Tetrapyrgos nigripes]|uniref:Uncharacterized protein n=1 Tax=Tetrapyrgos nigripes TaxID=182062 RepID=A0A8H5FJN6_9AGAR|nr:hypothetical protein D9758_016446 [Tetrapyrgos nigripes]
MSFTPATCAHEPVATNLSLGPETISLDLEGGSPEAHFLFPPDSPHPTYLEYFMGLEKSELCLKSKLNFIWLQADMASLLQMGKWCLAPTTETLEVMADLHRYNHVHPMEQRRHFLMSLPIQDYEFEFVTLGLKDPIFVQGPQGVNRFEFPYRNMPHFKCRVHPFLAAAHSHWSLRVCSGDWTVYKVAWERLSLVTSMAVMWVCDVPAEFKEGLHTEEEDYITDSADIQKQMEDVHILGCKGDMKGISRSPYVEVH